jgi:hypothetical protein
MQQYRCTYLHNWIPIKFGRNFLRNAHLSRSTSVIIMSPKACETHLIVRMPLIQAPDRFHALKIDRDSEKASSVNFSARSSRELYHFGSFQRHKMDRGFTMPYFTADLVLTGHLMISDRHQ